MRRKTRRPSPLPPSTRGWILSAARRGMFPCRPTGFLAAHWQQRGPAAQGPEQASAAAPAGRDQRIGPPRGEADRPASRVPPAPRPRHLRSARLEAPGRQRRRGRRFPASPGPRRHFQKFADGPVSRILSRTVIPLGQPLLAGSSDLPGGCGCCIRTALARRAGTLRRPWSDGLRIPPYLVLLRVGFTLPAALRRRRCALTAPFHPYRSAARASSRGEPDRGPGSCGGMFSVALAVAPP